MVEIAVMGFGTVGSGVVEVLTNHTDSISKRAKEQIDIKYILDLRDFPDKMCIRDRCGSLPAWTNCSRFFMVLRFPGFW